MAHLNGTLNRKLRMGLVGGGEGSFIGRVHATAAVIDNRAAIVAGALSSDPERAKASGPSYDIAADRAYGSYEEMLDKESALPDGERIDFVSVTTPNHVHFPVAKLAVEKGFNVMCDKPMTFDLAEAQELVKVVEGSDVVFAVTHNYTGHPLVRQAREMIAAGELGEIKAIRSSYIQGWLSSKVEDTAPGSRHRKQALWRTDPSKSGAAGAFGDIGTHAYNLARYTTGLLPEKVSAHLRTYAEGRQLDDYGQATIIMDNGAMLTVTASQISHGRENDLSIQIDGTKGSLEWHQENPNYMEFRQNGKPHQIIYRDPNGPFSTGLHVSACRLPSGHPEGYLEAFANVYRFAFDDMIKRAAGESFERKDTIYPNVYDGLDGMNFITQCVASSGQGGDWLDMSCAGARR